ncbi:MAG: hypothetical protein RLZZ450_3551 [Pseudomonadota bacterium]
MRVAYLFGSRATGKARSDSDLDLALSLSPNAMQSDELMLDLLDALARGLGPLGERADLVDLGRSSSSIGFRVIRDGICVLSRDPGERVRLEVMIGRRYDDDRRYRMLFRRAARAAAQRMQGGRG